MEDKRLTVGVDDSGGSDLIVPGFSLAESVVRRPSWEEKRK